MDQITTFQWITMAIAAFAAIVSTGSLLVSYYAFRAGGPRISVAVSTKSTYRRVDGSDDNPNGDLIENLKAVDVRVANRGRGPVEVASISLVIWAFHRTKLHRVEMAFIDMYRSDSIMQESYEISAGNERQWFIDFKKKPKTGSIQRSFRGRKRARNGDVEVWVHLANRKIAKTTLNELADRRNIIIQSILALEPFSDPGEEIRISRG